MTNKNKDEQIQSEDNKDVTLAPENIEQSNESDNYGIDDTSPSLDTLLHEFKALQEKELSRLTEGDEVARAKRKK